MWFFRKVKKSKGGSNANAKEPPKASGYTMEKKLFPISRPWGYSPEHVEEAVQKYIETIEDLNDLLAKQKEIIMKLGSEKEKLDLEYRKLQMQINFVNVPSIGDIQEEYIQKKFEDHFNIEDTKVKSKDKSSILQDALGSVKEAEKTKSSRIVISSSFEGDVEPNDPEEVFSNIAGEDEEESPKEVTSEISIEDIFKDLIG